MGIDEVSRDEVKKITARDIDARWVGGDVADEACRFELSYFGNEFFGLVGELGVLLNVVGIVVLGDDANNLVVMQKGGAQPLTIAKVNVRIVHRAGHTEKVRHVTIRRQQ